MTTDIKATAIILCGGKERRFGSNKALAVVDGRRVIDRVIERVGPLSGEIIVVTSAEKAALPLPGGTRLVVDRYPGKGPLGGIYTGLAAASLPLAIVVGCDMPFLSTELIQYMIGLADGFDAVVPRLDEGMIEPLHAIYSRTCLPEMKTRLESDRLSVSQLLGQLMVRYLAKAEYLPLDPTMLSFFNINYPVDLDRANKLAAGTDPASSAP
jgi:molybdopterin-guanine dinucleotide biosynthesis protein A